ncbi:MAG TPA: 4-alpha-glucanotransferase [Candidatus Binataceae bacterium]|nr:4-alpha-glucanotransferase [Candidatus Binataceae bacterium]
MKPRPPIERIAGVMVPLFSLRTRADAGIGDLAALAAMTDLAAAIDHRAVLLLPLDETAPGEASPYSALSVFAIDPIYIGLDGLAGVAPQQVARVRGALAHVPLSDRLTIRAARFELLEAALRHFTAHGEERAAVRDFAERHREWLDDYALYRALKDRFDFAAWEQWPDELRRREPGALERARADLKAAIDKYVYWQFLAHRQWAELRAHARARGVKLGGDLSFSPARDSAEVWANQQLFDLERTVGAPPDNFNPKGQHWGLPAPRWDRICADGFALLRRRIRHARELYDLIRVDHVVGLYRTFSFDLVSQAEGSFSPAAEPEQRAQGEAVLDAILEEAGPAIVLAEDLGVIPSFVRASLNTLGVPGYKVMRWEKIGDGASGNAFIAPGDYPELSLATTGTHDTDTLAEWWDEAPADERARMFALLALPAAAAQRAEIGFDEVRDAMLAALYAAPSRLVMIPIQDLFGWHERINLPGTVGPANWSWRLPLAIEDMGNDPALAARMARLRGMAMRGGR